jgi:energy-coupling factor transporter transmembrane protein EcfT
MVNRHKKYLVMCIVMMIIALILLINTVLASQAFRWASIFSFGGLFLCGLFLFISHWNSYRKIEKMRGKDKLETSKEENGAA